MAVALLYPHAPPAEIRLEPAVRRRAGMHRSSRPRLPGRLRPHNAPRQILLLASAASRLLIGAGIGGGSSLEIIDRTTGTRGEQEYVEMRDGVRLNTFVFLPAEGGPKFPTILARTPYGITSPPGEHRIDPRHGWVPAPDSPLRGSILRGWKEIVARGYACVYQDTRGRYASEGEDRVYFDDAQDGYDTIDWIANQSWCDGRIGMSGSSAGATTTLAAASRRHPALKAFWAQVGGSSIYDDVVYEGQSIEMERLWLWVAKNIPGLSRSHHERARRLAGVDDAQMDAAHRRAIATYQRLETASHAALPFVDSPDWLHLPLTDYPDFSLWQPFLNELITHPAPDDFRAAHNFRRTIEIPGFHATSWYDIFLTSVMAAFREIQERTGTQKLWIGPNDHYFIYENNFWPRDPYFEWFGHYLKGVKSDLIDEPAVYFSPRAFVEDRAGYTPDDWIHSSTWPARRRRDAAALSHRGRQARPGPWRRESHLCLRSEAPQPDARRSEHADRQRPQRPTAGAGAA